MTPEIPDDVPVPAMSELSRVTGVFFEPKKAFTDIAQRPRWIVPLALVILCGLAYMFAFSQRIGWEGYIRQSMEGNTRVAQLTPEQREKQIEMGAKFASPMAYAGVIVGNPVSQLICAGIVLLIFNSFYSAQVKFKQVFAILCYSGLPNLLFMILATAVMFLKNPDDFNLRNPLAFNPGAFMDPLTASKPLYAFATSIDLFTIWILVLVAVGLTAAARKVSFGGALAGVAVPWLGFVLVRSALAGVFG